jgi:uncharacterized tellurite resistance protein B-like protein
MQTTAQLLEGHSAEEKEAYIGAIASIATADRESGEEEQQYLEQLSDAAGLSADQKDAILQASTDTSGTQLTTYLDTLKNSELKYALVTDLMSFAKADSNYSEEEQGSIKKVADYLGVNEQQVSVLHQVAEKAASGEITPEQSTQPGFLSSLGLGNQLQSAGINGGGLLKNLLGMAAPMILGGLLSRGLGNRNNSSNSGGMLGGNGGLLGGLLGGNSGGGLGSLIGMLNGGRGMGSTGGLLGRVLGGAF